MTDERASQTYRDAAEIRWLLCWPPAPYWPDSLDAGRRLVEACLARLAAWRPRVSYAEGALPAPGVYGIPEQWPHIRDLLVEAGFVPGATVETVWVARIGDLQERGRTAPDRRLVRTLGISGTRLTAIEADREVGYVEVDTNREPALRLSRGGGWADVGNLYVDPARRREGIGSWLLAQAAAWLELGEVTRLLDYTGQDDAEGAAFRTAVGFRPLTRTERDFTLQPS